MASDQKFKERAKKILELMQKWEEAISARNMEEVGRYATEIENLGKDFMKELWQDLKPGESLSQILKNLLEEQ